MILRCALVDDEPLALSLLESYVRKTDSLELCGSYSSAIQAMKSLPEHPVDLLFLDIQMPELNGLEFSRMVSDNTRIIFTTAFEQYAIDGYRVNALDYLLKPISYNDFIEAVNKALQWFELRKKAETPDSVQTEGLYQNLHRRQSTSHPVPDEYENHGRKTPFQPVHPRPSVVHCAETENKNHRQGTNRFWQRVHSCFRQLQTRTSELC